MHAIFQGYSQNCWIPWDPIRCSKMHKNAVRNSRNWGWEKYLKKRLLATWVLQGLSRFFLQIRGRLADNQLFPACPDKNCSNGKLQKSCKKITIIWDLKWILLNLNKYQAGVISAPNIDRKLTVERYLSVLAGCRDGVHVGSFNAASTVVHFH